MLISEHFGTTLQSKTQYTINIDTPELITQCSTKINSDGTIFPDPQIVITRGEFVVCNYTFTLLETKVGLAKLKLNITDVKAGMMFLNNGIRLAMTLEGKANVNLSGFKIVQIDEHPTDPVVHFGNGVKLYKGQPHSFSGNPSEILHQRTVHIAQETYPVLI